MQAETCLACLTWSGREEGAAILVLNWGLASLPLVVALSQSRVCMSTVPFCLHAPLGRDRVLGWMLSRETNKGCHDQPGPGTVGFWRLGTAFGRFQHLRCPVT